MRQRYLSWLGIAMTVCGGLSTVASAAQIYSDGVLGNSGEQGTSMVRFAPVSASGMGIIYDRFGSLWDRGGTGCLNRYAVDGRLLAQYVIPKNKAGGDRLTCVGNLIVMLVNNQILTLPIDAQPGAAAKPLNVAASQISTSNVRGVLVCADPTGKLFLLDPVSGQRTDIPVAVPQPVRDLEVDQDGTVYELSNDRKLYAVKDGVQLTDGWPKTAAGDRIQLLDGAWFGQVGGGTIRRYNLQGQDDPGVVLGGSSGSFIGHLDGNYELNAGRGMAKLEGDRYAISGIGGVMHILVWHADTKQMEIVRRIGALADVKGMCVDRQGRVSIGMGSWNWNDPADAPLHNGIPMEFGGQGAVLDNETALAPGWQYGSRQRLLAGSLNTELSPTGDGVLKYDHSITGTTVYKQDRNRKLIMLLVTTKGEAHAYSIDPFGRCRDDEGAVTLATTQPTKSWTTLGMKDDDTLLAGADGQVIEFAHDGLNWKETARWRTWGDTPDAQFGNTIYLCTDAGRLWVADRERQRVLCFDASTRKLLASFGTVDTKGTSLQTLDSPQIISARGDRAVVFDAGNQRLVKLRFNP